MLLVAVAQQSGTPSLDTIPSEHPLAKGSLVPGKEVEDTMLHMLEAISEEMIDKNAALARTSLQAQNGCGRKNV